MIKMYDKLVSDSRNAYLKNSALIQGSEGFEYCIKEKGLFNYVNNSENEHYSHMKDVNYYELNCIIPPFQSVYIEYEFLNKPTPLQDLPDIYGVHMTYMQDKGSIYDILVQNEYMIKQFDFPLENLQDYIEKNVGYLCMFNLFWQNSGSDNIHNYTTWIILCDFNGKVMRSNEDVRNKSATFGIVNSEFFSERKDYSKEEMIDESSSLLSISNEFIKVACVILSSINSGEFLLFSVCDIYILLNTNKTNRFEALRSKYKGMGY